MIIELASSFLNLAENYGLHWPLSAKHVAFISKTSQLAIVVCKIEKSF